MNIFLEQTAIENYSIFGHVSKQKKSAVDLQFSKAWVITVSKLLVVGMSPQNIINYMAVILLVLTNKTSIL